MKSKFFVICVLFCLAASAAPFITPSMMKRNGLTDEQYETLWKLGRNPRIDQSAAREWMFRSSRYQNVTNWLEVCGRTNNFAKLSYKLQGDNDVLTETNKIVVAENNTLTKSNVVLEVNLEYAEIDAKKARKIEKAAQQVRKKDQKNFEKWISDTQKAKKKSSAEMAEFYDYILELAKEEE